MVKIKIREYTKSQNNKSPQLTSDTYIMSKSMRDFLLDFRDFTAMVLLGCSDPSSLVPCRTQGEPT